MAKNSGRHSIINRLVARDGPQCHWCAVMTYPGAYDNLGRRPPDFRTRDHLIPRTAGGPDSLANQVVACDTCNKTRGSTPADVWGDAIAWAFGHPVTGQPTAITARSWLGQVEPADLPRAGPGKRSEGARRRDRRHKLVVVVAAMTPGQRMSCPTCGRVWSVRDPAGVCECPPPREPWPPPDPGWVSGAF